MNPKISMYQRWKTVGHHDRHHQRDDRHDDRQRPPLLVARLPWQPEPRLAQRRQQPGRAVVVQRGPVRRRLDGGIGGARQGELEQAVAHGQLRRRLPAGGLEQVGAVECRRDAVVRLDRDRAVDLHPHGERTARHLGVVERDGGTRRGADVMLARAEPVHDARARAADHADLDQPERLGAQAAGRVVEADQRALAQRGVVQRRLGVERLAVDVERGPAAGRRAAGAADADRESAGPPRRPPPARPGRRGLRARARRRARRPPR